MFEKAKDYLTGVSEKTLKYVSEDAIADMIVVAANKQELINQKLKERGSDCRVGSIQIELGLSPTVVLGVTRLSEPPASE